MAKCAKCGQSAAWNAPMGLCDNCQRERQQLAQQRLEVHATRGANPGLIAVDPEDRILDNAWTLLISSGIETGVRAQTGTVTLALRNDALEVWGTDDLGNFEAIRLLRDEIIEIEIGGGEFVTSGGGVIGGGFGLEGAAIGMAAASIINALTTRTSQNPIVLTVMTSRGLVALTSTSLGVLDCKGLLAPVFADAVRNTSGSLAPR